MAQGQQVGLLALFEPQTPPLIDGHWNRFRFDLLSERLRFHIGNLQKLKFKEAGLYIQDRVRTLFHYFKGFSNRFVDLRVTHERRPAAKY